MNKASEHYRLFYVNAEVRRLQSLPHAFLQTKANQKAHKLAAEVRRQLRCRGVLVRRQPFDDDSSGSD